MRKFIGTVLAAIIMVLVVFAAVTPASAMSSACEEAQGHDWRAHWANALCYISIKYDLFGDGWDNFSIIVFGGDGDGVSGDGDDITGASGDSDDIAGWGIDINARKSGHHGG